MTALPDIERVAPKSRVKPNCLHCGSRVVTRPRGLCRVCYKDTGIRPLYPPTSAKTRKPPVPGSCTRCGGPTSHGARRLCIACWNAPGVRQRFGFRNGVAAVGAGEPVGLEAAPCPHRPGSPGRVETLCRRAAAGVSLYHPQDCDGGTAEVPPGALQPDPVPWYTRVDADDSDDPWD